MLDMTNPQLVKEHTHAPDKTACKYTQCRNEMRRQAASTHDDLGQIFAKTIPKYEKDVHARLPAEDSVKRSMRYHRRMPPVPKALKDFALPEEWTKTTGPEPQHFLLYDNGSSLGLGCVYRL